MQENKILVSYRFHRVTIDRLAALVEQAEARRLKEQGWDPVVTATRMLEWLVANAFTKMEDDARSAAAKGAKKQVKAEIKNGKTKKVKK